MPFVDNIVFWRGTNSALLFTQQFGRWLRGKFVKFYDYVWGIKNIVWINNLVQEIRGIWEKEKELEEIIEVHIDKKEEKIKKHKNTFESWEIDIYEVVWEIQEIKKNLRYPIANKEEIMMIYKNQELQDTNLSKANYKKFAKYFNRVLVWKYRFKLPQTRSIFKQILGIKENIINRDDIKKVLLWEKIERLRIATLQEIKVLFHNKQLNTDLLTRRKYAQYVKEFDRKYSQKLWMQLPRTWHAFNLVLSIDKNHRNKKNILKVLSGEKIEISKDIKIGNKKDAQILYEKWIIQSDFLTSKKWWIHQEEIEKTYRIRLPRSFEWFMYLLLWKEEWEKIKKRWEKIPRQKKLAIHLLLGKTLKEQEIKRWANKEDIISIKESIKNYLSDKKLKLFIKENAHKYDFEIPRSMNGLISVMGWDNTLSSWAKYFEHLCNGWWVYEAFEIPKATIADISKLVKNWEIDIHDLSRTGWKLKYAYLKERKFTFQIPGYESLVYIITGFSKRKKWGKRGKQHLFDILKNHIHS